MPQGSSISLGQGLFQVAKREARGRLTSNLATFTARGCEVSARAQADGWESGINQAPCWQLGSPLVLAAPYGGRTLQARRSREASSLHSLCALGKAMHTALLAGVGVSACVWLGL